MRVVRRVQSRPAGLRDLHNTQRPRCVAVPPSRAGFYVFVRALQLLKAHNNGVLTVGLAGPSGSGKTSFSEKIKAFMPGARQPQLAEHDAP